jgi:hypothetical protein
MILTRHRPESFGTGSPLASKLSRVHRAGAKPDAVKSISLGLPPTCGVPSRKATAPTALELSSSPVMGCAAPSRRLGFHMPPLQERRSWKCDPQTADAD